MFVLSVLEAPNTKTNSKFHQYKFQTHLAIKLFLILNLVAIVCQKDNKYIILQF